MTIESSELFELCKQVFEKTGWGSTDLDKQMYVETEFGPDYVESIGDGETFWEFPLYTSDYLLGRLPSEQYETLQLIKAKNYWRAGVGQMGSETSDTPLKALLKLTLKLHEEKIL